jgi:hypothetical protein
MIIVKGQKAIMDSIIKELSKNKEDYAISPMFDSVWFCPELGLFLYADSPIHFDIIYPLISEKILVFKGIEKHQGDKMVRYMYNEKSSHKLTNLI